MITGDALGRLLKNVGLATRMAGFSIGKAHEPRVLRFSFDCLTSCRVGIAHHRRLVRSAYIGTIPTVELRRCCRASSVPVQHRIRQSITATSTLTLKE